MICVGLIPFTQHFIMALIIEKLWEAMKCCHIRLQLHFLATMFTGQTGEPMLLSEPTSGMAQTLVWSNELLHSPLIYRFFTPVDSPEVC